MAPCHVIILCFCYCFTLRFNATSFFDVLLGVSLPYSERALSQALGQKFGVRGIPSFVILDAADASIKDKDARTTVANAHGDISKATPKWA